MYPPLDGESPDGGGLLNAGVARLNKIQANGNVAGDGGKGSALLGGNLPIRTAAMAAAEAAFPTWLTGDHI